MQDKSRSIFKSMVFVLLLNKQSEYFYSTTDTSYTSCVSTSAACYMVVKQEEEE